MSTSKISGDTPALTSASPRRQELLNAITACMARTGLVNLSLREIARQIGISAPALIHHFGNKETLLREALGAIHEQESETLELAFRSQDVTSALEALWHFYSTPAQRRCLAAATEIQSIVQNDPARFPNYHQHLSRPWIAGMHDALERAGCPEAERIALATLLIGSFRGLLGDLLATGESKRINAAFGLLLESTRQLEESWC